MNNLNFLTGLCQKAQANLMDGLTMPNELSPYLEPKLPEHVEPIVGDVPSLLDVAVNIIRFMAMTLTTVAVLGLFVGAILYLTSFGKEPMIAKAKESVKWSIWGMIMGLLSFAIVALITNSLNFVDKKVSEKLPNQNINQDDDYTVSITSFEDPINPNKYTFSINGIDMAEVNDISWDIDGTVFSDNFVVHEFEEAGTHTVTANITDMNGDTYSPTSTVVTEEVNASLIVNPVDDFKYNFSISGIALGQISSFSFTVDGDVVYSGASAISFSLPYEHEFQQPGDYHIKLDVLDNYGEAHTDETDVTVSGTEEDFSILPSFDLDKPGEVVFSTNVDVDDIANIAWSMDGSTVGSSPVYSHQFTNSGTYSLSATLARDSNPTEVQSEIEINYNGTQYNPSITYEVDSVNPAIYDLRIEDIEEDIIDLIAWSIDDSYINITGKEGISNFINATDYTPGNHVIKTTIITVFNDIYEPSVTINIEDFGVTISKTADPDNSLKYYFTVNGIAEGDISSLSFEIDNTEVYSASSTTGFDLPYEHEFEDAGDYNIKLDLIDMDGNSHTDETNVTVTYF